MTLKPYWHGRMTDRGTVFWCENVDGKAIVRKEQYFWAMQYADIKDVEPYEIGYFVAEGNQFNGIYKDGSRILVAGRG